MDASIIKTKPAGRKEVRTFVKIENDYSIKEVAFFDEPNYSSNEEKFQKLWKSFFSGVTINERTNLKLQTQMVPLLYRTYMSEFKA